MNSAAKREVFFSESMNEDVDNAVADKFQKRKKIKLIAPGVKGDMSEAGSQIGDADLL